MGSGLRIGLGLGKGKGTLQGMDVGGSGRFSLNLCS